MWGLWSAYKDSAFRSQKLHRAAQQPLEIFLPLLSNVAKIKLCIVFNDKNPLSFRLNKLSKLKGDTSLALARIQILEGVALA